MRNGSNLRSASIGADSVGVRGGTSGYIGWNPLPVPEMSLPSLHRNHVEVPLLSDLKGRSLPVVTSKAPIPTSTINENDNKRYELQ